MIGLQTSVADSTSILILTTPVGSSSSSSLQVAASTNTAVTINGAGSVSIDPGMRDFAGPSLAGLVAGVVVSFALIVSNSPTPKKFQYGSARAVAFEQYVPLAQTALPRSGVWVIAPALPSWASLLESNGLAVPPADMFMRVVDGLLDMVSDKSFTVIDGLFDRVDVTKVSTDFLIAMLRLTHADRSSLTSWSDFLARVRPELMGRSGVDATLELVGLDGDSDTA